MTINQNPLVEHLPEGYSPAGFTYYNGDYVVARVREDKDNAVALFCLPPESLDLYVRYIMTQFNKSLARQESVSLSERMALYAITPAGYHVHNALVYDDVMRVVYVERLNDSRMLRMPFAKTHTIHFASMVQILFHYHDENRS